MRLGARQTARRAICRTLAMLAALIAVLASSPATPALQIDVPFLTDEDSPETTSAIRDKLSALEGVTDEAGRELRNEILSFYQARGYQPAWSGTERARRWGKRVRYALQHAYEQGLRPARYASALIDSDTVPAKGNAAAAYDIEMTAAILRYAHDARTGRFEPTQAYKDIDLPPRHFDASTGLSAALRHNSLDSFLDELPPSHLEYRRLVAALARYRAAAARGATP